MEKEVLKVSQETREVYEAPKCEVMELQMEGGLCASSGWNPDGGHINWGDGTTQPANRRDSNRR